MGATDISSLLRRLNFCIRAVPTYMYYLSYEEERLNQNFNFRKTQEINPYLHFT